MYNLHSFETVSIMAELFNLRAPKKITADDTLIFFFTFIFRRKQGLMFHVNPLPNRVFT